MADTCPKYGAAALFLVALSASWAWAELLVYEPFDYPDGTQLDGLPATGRNLSGSYDTSTIQDLEILSPGLGHGMLLDPLPSVAGNRLSDADGAGSGVVTVALAEPVSIGEGQQTFFSALLTLDDTGNGNRLADISLLNTSTGELLVFGESIVGIRAIRVAAATDATEQLVADSLDEAFVNGQTLWMIGRYQNSPDPEGDLLELVVYDTAAEQHVPESFDPLDPNAQVRLALSGLDIDFTRIDAIQFTVRGASNNFVDELRIGTTYASVAVPEPPAGAMLLMMLVLANRFLPRRGRARPGGRRGGGR